MVGHGRRVWASGGRRGALAGLLLVTLAVPAALLACSSGGNGDAAYFRSASAILADAASQRQNASKPTLDPTVVTLTGDEKAQIQARYHALSAILSDAASRLDQLTPPGGIADAHRRAVLALRGQSSGLDTLSQREPSLDTADLDLSQYVLPDRHRFEAACAELKAAAEAANVSVVWNCGL